MKTLSDVDQTKLAATAKANDVGRQLAFAGLAVVWILREATETPIDPLLIIPLALFVVALAFDLSQYVWCSFAWTVFYNFHFERCRSDRSEIDIPGWINWPAYFFFWAKLFALLIGWGGVADVAIEKWKLFT